MGNAGGTAPSPVVPRSRDRNHANNGVDMMLNGIHTASMTQKMSHSRSMEQIIDEDFSGRSMTFSINSLNSRNEAQQSHQAHTNGDSNGEMPRKVPHLRYDGNSHPTSSVSAGSRRASLDTVATSIHTLPPLQTKGPPDERDRFEPNQDDDPGNYELVAPVQSQNAQPQYSLEARGEEMFSKEHLQIIFDDPKLLVKFTTFLSRERKSSIPILVHYLDSLKAVRAIKYANAVVESLEPVAGHDFTRGPAPITTNDALTERARQAFEVLVREDLPAYITHIFIKVVSASIQSLITGTLPPHLREQSEGLAEVFCLSDPSRPDNPIVMASEEFHRTTQYGMSYAMGRNCRFLQGPRTDKNSTRRLKEAIATGRDHSETFINYRRDGSPFLNLLMVAALRDSRGKLRYFIGAQVDVSGLAKEATDLEGLQRLIDIRNGHNESKPQAKDELQELSEMLNVIELDVVKKTGGGLLQERAEAAEDNSSSWSRPRLVLKDQYSDEEDKQTMPTVPLRGRLSGVYEHYMLVRPAPSLRILFTSPSLRLPGMLQSPFMNRIGSSERVRNELLSALNEGRGVTAKVKWVSKVEDEGRNRWIHCTPLIQNNGTVGVWMIVLVDDETSKPQRRFRPAPPVAIDIRNQNASLRGQKADPWAVGSSYSRTSSLSITSDRDNVRLGT